MNLLYINLKNKLAVLFIIILYSCSQMNNEYNNGSKFNCKLYYDNGKLKSEGDTMLGEYDGPYREYYINGRIKYINNYKNGLLDGEQYEFFENGNPKINMYYILNKPVGIQYGYFEKDSMKIARKNIFVNFQDSIYWVTKMEFNDRSDTIIDDSKVKIKLSNDTINLNEKLKIFFKLNYPKFNNCRVHIGNFDRSLKLIDSMEYKTYEGIGNEISVYLVFNSKGKKNIRGYIEDFKIDSKNIDGSYSTIGSLNNWFDIDIFVK